MVNNNNKIIPNTSPIHTVSPKRIVENLYFLFENKEEVVILPDQPLKERVVLAQLNPNALNRALRLENRVDKGKVKEKPWNISDFSLENDH